MYLINCWVEHPVIKLDQTFTYIYEKSIDTGVRVEIDFKNQNIIGFVENSIKLDEDLNNYEKKLGYSLKPIKKILDDKSLITKELHKLGKWMAKDTISPTILCYQTMLPNKVKPISNKQKLIYVKKIKVKNNDFKFTLKQQAAYDYIKENKEVFLTEFNKKFPNMYKALDKKEALIVFEVLKSGSLKIEKTGKKDIVDLSPDQYKVINKVLNTKKRTVLLHGVTGSGKTEIYLQLAKRIIDNNKQVLILVPEISLTPQMVNRVVSRFYDNVAIYHSNLSSQEKYEQYKKVLESKVKVVVGTRSAVFMPFSNLGLIVMDEEHDLSYKQDGSPCYHCRDIAIKRAENFDCKVLLGSATPSLDSYARALRNVYELVELPNRINNKVPNIKIVSIGESIKSKNSYIITNILKEKIQEKLDKNEQIILLLNRRGFTTSLKCNNCNHVIMCPHCDLAMSYHHDIKMMKCHTCNAILPVPNVCPICNERNTFFGFGYGTQRLENEVRKMFPTAKILRMDSDTTSRKGSHEAILSRFSNHDADILLGTQMISKGLDYPNVTLVGILNGDAGLSRVDYRSQELTFDLLLQASGRSGRSDKDGEVIIQVYDKESFVIKAALKQDYKTFFKNEMVFRKAGGYPPYNYLIALIFSHSKKDVVTNDSYKFLEGLNGNFKVLGPSELLKISDRYRNRIILKGKDLEEMKEVVRNNLKDVKLVSRLKIDINPMLLD
ncbi:MAG: primosomal protein N' [Erysipelotrichaceae bacterium]|nr:primosomal protein N' [Erysipelotrichaceae bacterium]